MKTNIDDVEKARRELILLYLGIKLRKESEVNNIFILLYLIQAISLTEEEYSKEVQELYDISLLDIINYVKNSIDVIVSFRVEEMVDEYKSNINDNMATDYETLLQKQEAALRQHISYEHQMKIEYEKTVERLELSELENKLLQYQIVSKIYK